MVDEVSRSAARLAALIAVPVALLAGLGIFALWGGAGDEPDPAGRTPPATAAPVPTGPVEMPARSLTEREQVVCRALLSQLPDRLDGLPQRPVTEGPEQNAAYGDPPVTVACGVPPAEFPPTGKVSVLSGVCWYPAEQAGATVFTTVDREVPVQVTVPATYEGQLVISFSPTIIESVLSTDTAPTGCSS